MSLAGCGGRAPEPPVVKSERAEGAPPAASTGSTAAAAESSGKKRTKATGTLTADPNPIQVCDGSGLGVTTVSGSWDGSDAAEVHLDAPDGALFMGGAGPGKTHKWVHDGMVFYLQDVSQRRPLTAENTIAKVTVQLTTAGCR